MPTIFFAWKSGDEKVNRHFIKDALERAAKEIGRDSDWYEPPRVDETTVGVAGWPDVMSTILAKIAKCDVFVADVTNIDPSIDRVTPNPNVMFELGYALATLGEARIVLVLNNAFFPSGKGLADMPFDIRGRRGGIQYTLREVDEKAPARRALVSALAEAFRLCFDHGPIGAIVEFFRDTNPVILERVAAGSRRLSVMVAQHRMQELQKLGRPPYDRFVQISPTGSMSSNNTNVIGGHINDVAPGMLSGFTFTLQPAFVLPK